MAVPGMYELVHGEDRGVVTLPPAQPSLVFGDMEACREQTTRSPDPI